MKKSYVLILAMMLVLLASCGGGKFTAEKATLGSATKAMETFVSAIQSADSPDLVASALGAFSSSFEKILPAMKKMKDEHADWETTPPDGLKDAFASFEGASEKFKGVMPKVMQMAGEHADNPALQSAVAKFREVVSGL